MNIKQLQELYKQYEELARSGEDVVYEIKKNINNGEIEILKDDIIPNIMRQIGRTLSSLKCQLDISLQYDSSSGISYTFCKSDSDIMIENTVPIEDFEKEQDGISPEIESEDASDQNNRIRSGITVLRITMPNGKVFDDKKAYKSLIGFIEEVGTDLVASLGIQYNDFPFMTREPIFLPHHDTKDGWHIQTNTSTKQKNDIVNRICRELGVDATVEIVDRAQLTSERFQTIIKELSDNHNLTNESSNAPHNVKSNFQFNDLEQKRMFSSVDKKPSLLGFKEYLAQLKSNKGKYYSASSQQVYASCCFSDYMKDKVYAIIGSKNLFDITNLSDFNTLSTEVDADIKNGTKNSVPRVALQLYKEYIDVCFPNHFIQDTIIKHKSIDYYIKLFQGIESNKPDEMKNPNIAIFIITILKCIDKGVIVNNRIYLNDDFIREYSDNWNQYIKTGCKFKKDICSPYFLLTKESFYYLCLKKYILDIDQKWTMEDVRNYCKFAYLENDLYSIAKERRLMEKLIYTLIDCYDFHMGMENEFSINHYLDNSNMITVDNHKDVKPMIDFEDYDEAIFHVDLCIKNEKGLGQIIKNGSVVVFAGNGVIKLYHGILYFIQQGIAHISISILNHHTQYSLISERVIYCNDSSPLFNLLTINSMKIDDIRRIQYEYYVMVDSDIFDNTGSYIYHMS